MTKYLSFLIIMLLSLLLIQHKATLAQDKIQFLDGNTIEVFIITVKADIIKAYTTDGKSIQTFFTSNIRKVEYKNGTTLYPNQESYLKKNDQINAVQKLHEIDLPQKPDPTTKINQEIEPKKKDERKIRFGTIIHTEAPSTIVHEFSDKNGLDNKKKDKSSCLIFSDKRIHKDLIGYYERDNMRTNKDRYGILDDAKEFLIERLNQTSICQKYSNFSKIEIELLALNFIWDDSKGSLGMMSGHTLTKINVVYYLNDFAVKNETFTGSTELHKYKRSTQHLMFEKSIEDLIKKMGL